MRFFRWSKLVYATNYDYGIELIFSSFLWNLCTPLCKQSIRHFCLMCNDNTLDDRSLQYYLCGLFQSMLFGFDLPSLGLRPYSCVSNIHAHIKTAAHTRAPTLVSALLRQMSNAFWFFRQLDSMAEIYSIYLVYGELKIRWFAHETYIIQSFAKLGNGDLLLLLFSVVALVFSMLWPIIDNFTNRGHALFVYSTADSFTTINIRSFRFDSSDEMKSKGKNRYFRIKNTTFNVFQSFL